jgi:phosphohistidine phosphatase
MKLYLMQHGEAMSKAENPERPLNEQGRKNATRVANFLAQAGIRIHQIRHSGKRRAKDTATIVAKHVQTQSSVVAVDDINPNDDVRPVAEGLQSETNDVMLIGHLPFLSRLAGFLLTGDPERAVIQFKNAGVVCLERQEENWAVAWIVIPEILRN